MYTIANKHNKKTRKLSSSSRNKHKSKSKNKRKHKYTIGKTRKYTKSHNTIHIGGYLKRREGKQASSPRQKSVQDRPETVQALPAPASASQRAKQTRQPQRQSVVTISDTERVLTPTSTQLDSDAESQRVKTELEAKKKAEEEKLRAEAEAKKAEEESLKAQAEAAKKEQREAKRKAMEAESEKMYNRFITTINTYDFETDASVKAPYIIFSKFIQEIMDLQFSIKDDGIRKKAQTITDQILTAYSALISYNCSTKFLKQHFQTYINKLKIQDSVTITDPKLPSLNIDEVDESIKTKLETLANTQVCDHPLSEHLVKEPVTDSDSRFRFPSFTIPSFNNPFKRTTQLPEITPTTSTPKASAASADSPDPNDQNDNATTNPSSPPPGSVIQLKTFGDNPDEEPEEGRTRTPSQKLTYPLRPTTRTSATGSTRTTPNASRRAPASGSINANVFDDRDSDLG